MSERVSQKQECLKYIEEHGSITPLEALHAFGCFRLASVISRLRKDGYPIASEIVEGERYAIYTLIQD